MAAVEEGEAVAHIVGRGARESVMEMEAVGVPRRVILTEEVPVGVWLSWEVTEGVGESVDVCVVRMELLGV